MHKGELIMNKKYFVYVVLILVNVIVCRSALADEKLENDTDILGFKLSMTQKQAKDYFTHNYKKKPTAMIQIDLKSPDNFKTKILAGFVADIKNNKNELDRIAVLFNPNKNSNDIFAISRYTKFMSGYSITKSGNTVDGTLMLKTVLLDSLIKKYGEPMIKPDVFTKNEVYIWALNQDSFYDSNNNSACNQYNYFYELPPESGDLKYAVSSISNNFVSSINLPLKLIKSHGHCGVILAVEISTANIWPEAGYDYRYVGSMYENLINVTKGTKEIEQFINVFSAGANMAEKEKHEQDSKNKPKL